jgi:uncharacterized protein YcgI (DUF1989 family)
MRLATPGPDDVAGLRAAAVLGCVVLDCPDLDWPDLDWEAREVREAGAFERPDRPELLRDVPDEERVEVDLVVLLERLAGEDPRTSTSGSA